MNVSAQSVRTESHIVQAGETLYSIARRYEVNVDAILKVNPGLQADRIMAGQAVVIPVKGAATASVLQSAVEADSGNVPSQTVTPSQTVPLGRVQKQHDGLPQYKTKHEVKKKETVYSISRMYGVSEQELLDANPVLKKKKLKKGKYYKYVVVAYKNVDGKKVTIAASKTIHVTTKNGKYGNAKAVKVNKTKQTIKKGKSVTIKASQIKLDKTIKKHTAIRYESSNSKIATVNSKGKITAKKKGTCKIYVYAQNGMSKTVTVTVK